jgi:uncharacterized protein YecE (DUF72 family)
MIDSASAGPGAPQQALQGICLGCAGWSIPGALADLFPAHGSQLERYGKVFGAVEINSSFYRPHRHATYARWAASVPEHFRFAVKLPRIITHERRLQEVGTLLDAFLADVAGLGKRLGCLLVQLPPSLEYRSERLLAFLDELQRRHRGAVALEPRHPSWFDGLASVQLAARRVARVAADPSPGRGGCEPAGDRRLSYFRLHGTPRTYYSEYDPAALAALAPRLEAARRQSEIVWCIFDNTALGAAQPNALAVQALLAGRARPAEAAAPATARRPPALSAGRSAAPATGTQA